MKAPRAASTRASIRRNQRSGIRASCSTHPRRDETSERPSAPQQGEADGVQHVPRAGVAGAALGHTEREQFGEVGISPPRKPAKAEAPAAAYVDASAHRRRIGVSGESIDLFTLLIAAASLAAGALASVTGFGIGSLLTPALASSLDARVAVAAVSIPHLAGTALRFWMLKGHVDRRVFWRFGLMSAGGGLAGALLHARATSPALMILFGALLIFVAISQVTGLARRMRFHGPAAWMAGGTSGLLGGLVGNQGGIRSAALLGFDLRPETFVATATATRQIWVQRRGLP